MGKRLFWRLLLYTKHFSQVDDGAVATASGSDVTSGLPFMQGELTVTRHAVASYTGIDGFHCTCYASGSNDNSAVRSNRARVAIACKSLFLSRQHFTPCGSRQFMAHVNIDFVSVFTRSRTCGVSPLILARLLLVKGPRGQLLTLTRPLQLNRNSDCFCPNEGIVCKSCSKWGRKERPYADSEACSGQLLCGSSRHAKSPANHSFFAVCKHKLLKWPGSARLALTRPSLIEF